MIIIIWLVSMVFALATGKFVDERDYGSAATSGLLSIAFALQGVMYYLGREIRNKR